MVCHLLVYTLLINTDIDHEGQTTSASGTSAIIGDINQYSKGSSSSRMQRAAKEAVSGLKLQSFLAVKS